MLVIAGRNQPCGLNYSCTSSFISSMWYQAGLRAFHEMHMRWGLPSCSCLAGQGWWLLWEMSVIWRSWQRNKLLYFWIPPCLYCFCLRLWRDYRIASQWPAVWPGALWTGGQSPSTLQTLMLLDYACETRWTLNSEQIPVEEAVKFLVSGTHIQSVLLKCSLSKTWLRLVHS